MKIVDYAFYVFATWLRKGDEGHSRAGILIGFLFLLVPFVPLAYGLTIVRKTYAFNYLDAVTYLAIILWIPLLYLVYKRYANAYPHLHHQWGQMQPMEARVKKAAVVLGYVMFLYLSYRVLHSIDLLALR